jgi:hypothetical protein
MDGRVVTLLMAVCLATGIFGFQFRRDPDVAAHAGQIIGRHIPIEVRGAIHKQRLAALLEHLLFHNGDRRNLTTAVVSRSGIATEDANARIGRQLRIDVAHGCKEVCVNG